MTEYTPSTEQVRQLYANSMDPEGFDRWLAQVKSDVWQEGFEAGERDVFEHERTSYDAPCIRNPYREDEDEKEESEETP